MSNKAYQIQQKFFEEYSSQSPFKNIIYKIRKFENLFYKEMKEISNLESPIQEKVLDRTLKEYSLLLLQLRIRALMKVHTDFGHEVYQMIAKDFEFICNITENVMKTKVKELKRKDDIYYFRSEGFDIYIHRNCLKNLLKYNQ